MFTTVSRIAATTATTAVLSAVGAMATLEPAQAWLVNRADDGGYNLILEHHETLEVAALGVVDGREVTRPWCTAMVDGGLIPKALLAECTYSAAICAVNAVEEDRPTTFMRIYADYRSGICLVY